MSYDKLSSSSIDMYDAEGLWDGGGCMWLFIGLLVALSGVSDLCTELCECIAVVEGSTVIGGGIELVLGGSKAGVCIELECNEGGEYCCVCCVFPGFPCTLCQEGVWSRRGLKLGGIFSSSSSLITILASFANWPNGRDLFERMAFTRSV